MSGEITYKLASSKHAGIIKSLVNKMYGIEYEIRENSKIEQAIQNKTEIYVIAYDGETSVGFSGASLNNDYYNDVITPDVAVIDYIYVEENARNFLISFELISKLLKRLAEIGVKSAIMQVQTFNKQRFFHYALSDKTIIKSTKQERNGQTYEDQILLIKDLKNVSKITIKELMNKAHKYKSEEEDNSI